MQQCDKPRLNETKAGHKTNGRLIGLLLALCSPVLLAHCAPQDQVMMLERRVNNIALENATLSNKIAAMQSPGGASDVRSVQADLSNRVDELQAQILRINGMIDEMKHKNKADREEITRFANEVKTQIDNLKAQQDAMMSALPGGAKPAEGQSVQSGPAPAKEEAPQETDPYQQGMTLFKQKDFNGAKKDFQLYIDKNPSGKLVDSAYFWEGECEYSLEHFDEAILLYQKVISKFPKGNKAPDALLKQGMAFARLDDKQSARIVFEKLLKQYPRSEQAAAAKKQLSRLK